MLLQSAALSFEHWAVTPLLMVGGAYLCFEGIKKLAHKYLISATEQTAEHASRLASMSDLAVDLVALEKEKKERGTHWLYFVGRNQRYFFRHGTGQPVYHAGHGAKWSCHQHDDRCFPSSGGHCQA